MADRSNPSPLAAGSIWAVSLIGSWAMALAILGAINGEVIGCGPNSSASGNLGDGGVGGGGWAIVAVASIVPVLVMVGIAPAGRRALLIGLAGVVAGIGLVVANTWITPCL